jgi:hypothetical protein
MSEPTEFEPTEAGPAGLPSQPADEAARPQRAGRDYRRAVIASLVIAVATALAGVAAGFCWAAVAPRALLVITSPGAAGLANAETSAFISADGAFSLICLAGGLASGLLGYLFGVRRHGPLPMAALVVGAVAAPFLARWVGEQSGLATFHHLLATLPAGARLRDSLTLGAGGALALWPLAASAVAGTMATFSDPARRRPRGPEPSVMPGPTGPAAADGHQAGGPPPAP